MFTVDPQGGVWCLDDAQKESLSIIVATANTDHQSDLSSALSSQGFANSVHTLKYSGVLTRLQQRDFGVLLFVVEPSDLKASVLIEQAKALCPNIVCIAVSESPNIDEMFDLLIDGALAYVTLPIDYGVLEQAISYASQAEPFPKNMLSKENRCSAVVSAVLANLDSLASAEAHYRVNKHLEPYLPALYGALGCSVDLGIRLLKGDIEHFLVLLENAFIARGNDAATRLGRIRKRLATERES